MWRRGGGEGWTATMAWHGTYLEEYIGLMFAPYHQLLHVHAALDAVCDIASPLRGPRQL